MLLYTITRLCIYIRWIIWAISKHNWVLQVIEFHLNGTDIQSNWYRMVMTRITVDDLMIMLLHRTVTVLSARVGVLHLQAQVDLSELRPSEKSIYLEPFRVCKIYQNIS
jgi:hypothetical protein